MPPRDSICHSTYNIANVNSESDFTQNLNSTLLKIELIFYIVSSAAQTNSYENDDTAGYCGLQWEKEVAQEVTGMTCGAAQGLDQIAFDSAGTQTFDLISRVGGELRFGEVTDELDASTEAKRPDKPSTTIKLEKF